jgi:hypothetical protein
MAADVGVPSDGATLLDATLLSFSPSVGSDVKATLIYANPFNTAFGYGYTYVVAQTSFAVPLSAPQAMPSIYGVGAMGYAADQATFESMGPLVPLLTPVTNILVDGQSGFAGGMVSSTTPTISFGPPATGTPVRYQIRAIELVKNASGGTSFPLQGGGTVFSGRNTIQIPPGMLSSGSTYAFEIIATSYPTTTPVDPDAQPRYFPLPYATASAVAGPFTVM